MKNKFLIAAAALTVAFSSCEKEPQEIIEPTITDFPIPSTYNFDNVDYSGQTARLDMLDELTIYMKTGNIKGTVVDAAKLKNMYANVGSPFADADLNSNSKQLKNKTFTADIPQFEMWMDELAAASTSNVDGSNGTSGVVESLDGSKKYLFDSNGIEHIQLIEKGLMGAVMFYQGVSYYFENLGTQDNNTVTPGKGTDMEHYWDEAFGYFGVEKDFPANTNTRYWGKYCNGRDALMGCNKIIMDAFLKGRAAISNKDMVARDEAKQVIIKEWERVSAATAMHYINSAKKNFSDDALRNHALSECIAFTFSLKYNLNKKISQADIDKILDEHIGDNLYEVTIQNLNKALDLLASTYDLESVKNQL